MRFGPASRANNVSAGHRFLPTNQVLKGEEHYRAPAMPLQRTAAKFCAATRDRLMRYD
jgi:hypothetical protein